MLKVQNQWQSIHSVSLGNRGHPFRFRENGERRGETPIYWAGPESGQKIHIYIYIYFYIYIYIYICIYIYIYIYIFGHDSKPLKHKSNKGVTFGTAEVRCEALPFGTPRTGSGLPKRVAPEVGEEAAEREEHRA